LTLSGERHTGLKVIGDYKKLKIVVESVPRNEAGLTSEAIEKAVKLKLLSNGIKPLTRVNDVAPHFLHIDVLITPDGTFLIYISLQKYSYNYGVDTNAAGQRFKPQQGNYDIIGRAETASFIVDQVAKKVGDFLLDYFESNME
jgi:hypothetical protein